MLGSSDGGKDDPLIGVLYVLIRRQTHSGSRACLREDRLDFEMNSYLAHSPIALCNNSKLPWGND